MDIILSGLNKIQREIEALQEEISTTYNRSIGDIPIKKPTGIVRCKDCRWCRLRNGYTDRYACEWWKNSTGKNEFCSRAVRRGI